MPSTSVLFKASACSSSPGNSSRHYVRLGFAGTFRMSGSRLARAVIQVSGIGRTEGSTVAVGRGFTYCREGEIFGLIGPNGAVRPRRLIRHLHDRRPWSLLSAGRHSGRPPRIRIGKGCERRFSRSREHHRRPKTGQARESHRRQPSEIRAGGVARRPRIWLPVPLWFSSVAPLITSAASRPARKSSASEKRFRRWPPAAGHRARCCARLPDQRRPSGRCTACHPAHR